MLIKENNPWLGLASYEYKDAYRFFGREQEITTLKDAICNNLVTTIYGISGAGKTSLINAGISPLLEKEQYLPVPVRLDHRGIHSYSEQIINAVKTALAAVNAEIEKTSVASIQEELIPECEKLWLFFHTSTFWSESNHHICPVILIDQFEEIFTKNDDTNIIQSFFESINALQYDVPPTEIANALEQQEEYGDFNSARDFRVVLIMREDFLARLEDYSYDIPILRRNRVGIKRMNGLQAKEVILRPIPDIVSEEVALRIINKVSGRVVKNDPSYLEHLSIDTSLLSLFCSELYDKAVEQKMEAITEQLINQFGENILSSFYDNAMKLVAPSTVEFLETHLLTRSGYRNSMALEDLIENGITHEELIKLSAKRLVRIETSDGTDRVEFTHDILCEIAKQHRDSRIKAKEKRSGKKSTIGFMVEAVITFVFVLLLAGAHNIAVTICALLIGVNSLIVLPTKFAKDRNFIWVAICLILFNFLLLAMLIGAGTGLQDDLTVVIVVALYYYLLFILIFTSLRYTKRKPVKEFMKDMVRLSIYKQYPSFVKVLEVLTILFVLIKSFTMGSLLEAEYTWIAVPVMSIVCFLLGSHLWKVQINWNWKTVLLLIGQAICLILLVQSQFVLYHLPIMILCWVLLLASVFCFERKWSFSVGMWAMAFFIIPMLNIGYNVFSEPEYARAHNSTIKDYQDSRFIVTEDSHHKQGVRDRWNIVIPTEFDSIAREVCFVESESNPSDVVFYTYQNKQRQEWHCADHLDLRNSCTYKIVATYRTYSNSAEYANIYNASQYIKYLNKNDKASHRKTVSNVLLTSLAQEVKEQEISRLRGEWFEAPYRSHEEDSLRRLWLKTDSMAPLSVWQYKLAQPGPIMPYADYTNMIKSNFELMAVDRSGYSKALLLDTLYSRYKGEVDNRTYYVDLSYYILFARDFERAEAFAKEAVANDTSYYVSYTNLFTALYMQGKYAEAWPILEKYKDRNLVESDSVFKYFGDGIVEDFADLIRMGVYDTVGDPAYQQFKMHLRDYVGKPRYDGGVLWCGRELRTRTKEDGQMYWYMSSKNTILTPIMDGYYWHTDGNDSIVWYRTVDSNLCGYYRYCGTDSYTIEATYDHAWIFSEGLAAVEKDGKIGFINKNGEYVINPMFDYQYDKADIADKVDFVFHDGYCPMVSAPRHHGLINKQGEWVMQPIYSYINHPVNGYRIIRKDRLYGLLDADLNLVLPIEYTWINQNKEDNTITIEERIYTYSELKRLINKK